MKFEIDVRDGNLAIQNKHVLAFSLSLPRGISNLQDFAVCNKQGNRLPWQHKILDRYPDHSIRTAYIRFLPRGEAPFALSQGEEIQTEEELSLLYDRKKTSLDNGCFQVNLHRGREGGISIRPDAEEGVERLWRFYSEVHLWNGESCSSRNLKGTMRVEENGPLWCSITISGAYGHVPLEYQLRLQVARGLPLLYWQYRLSNMSEDEVKIRAAHCICSPVEVDAPLALVCQGEEDVVLRRGDEEKAINRKIPAYLAATSDGLKLNWGIRDLCNLYPKSLFAQDDIIGWGIFPANIPGDKLHFRHQDYQRGYWFDADGGLRLPSCCSWRTDGFLAWGPEAESMARIATDPPLVFPVILPASPWSDIAGIHAELPTAVQQEAERLIECYEFTQQDCRLFGFMDYGDSINADTREAHDQYGIWANGEQDSPCGPLLYYLISGQQKFWRAGYHAARHQMDIDTGRRGEGWIFSRHSVGHKMDRCVNSHFWLEGLALYYRLTGDEDAREVLEHTSQWLAQDLAATIAGDLPTIREIGLSLWMLSVAYELFPKKKHFLEIMKPHVDAVLALQQEDGSWQPYSKTEVALHRHPQYRKSRHFYNLAMGLVRYAQISGDQRIMPALHRSLRQALVDGGMLLPDGKGLFFDNAFALQLDESEIPEKEYQFIRDDYWDGSVFTDGLGLAYRRPYLHYFGEDEIESLKDEKDILEPWDTALFGLLEVLACVSQSHPDSELVEKGQALLQHCLDRRAGKGVEKVLSYLLWTPFLQHLPPYLAFYRRYIEEETPQS